MKFKSLIRSFRDLNLFYDWLTNKSRQIQQIQIEESAKICNVWKLDITKISFGDERAINKKKYPFIWMCRQNNRTVCTMVYIVVDFVPMTPADTNFFQTRSKATRPLLRTETFTISKIFWILSRFSWNQNGYCGPFCKMARRKCIGFIMSCIFFGVFLSPKTLSSFFFFFFLVCWIWILRNESNNQIHKTEQKK